MKPSGVVLTQLSVVPTIVIATYDGTNTVHLSYENIQASRCVCVPGWVCERDQLYALDINVRNGDRKCTFH